MGADEIHRAFVQGAGGLSVDVDLDPAVLGARRTAGDTGDLHRGGVDPGAVSVPVGEVDRTVRDNLVQCGGGGPASGERVERPPPTDDPVDVRARTRVRRDGIEVVLRRRCVMQVALEHVEAALDGVHVGILEPGDEHPPAEIDHLGSGTHELADDRVGADRHDAPVLDGDGLRP